MEKEQIDVVDLIINTLKEHEKILDLACERVVKSAEILGQVAKHSLDAEKLNRIEEYIVVAKSRLLDHKGLGVHSDVDEILEVYENVLKEIRK